MEEAINAGKTAYIHIGMMKTGTTSVQYFFDVNRDALKRREFHYSRIAGDRSHTGLACYALKDEKINDIRIRNGINHEKDVNAWREMFRLNLLEEFKFSFCKNALFSCENLASLLIDEREILLLKCLINDMFDNVKVIMYVRRQDKAIQSFYSTELKNGHSHDLNKVGVERYLHRFDYFSIFTRWAKVFGRKNVILRVFDENNLVNSDIIDDLEYLIEEIDFSGLKRPGRENESLGWVGTEMLKNLNPVVGMPTENGRINLSRGKLGDLISKFDNSPKEGVVSQRSDEIHEVFRRSNRDLELAAGLEMGSIFPWLGKAQSVENNKDKIDYKELFYESMEVIGKVWSINQDMLAEAQTNVHLNRGVAFLNEAVICKDKNMEKKGVMELLKAIKAGDKYGKAKELLRRWNYEG